jgi:protein TonB
MLNGYQKRQWQSLAMALGVESVLMVGVMGWAFQHLPAVPTEVIPLSIEVLMEKPPEKLAAREPPPKIKTPPSPQSVSRPQTETPPPLAQQPTVSESHAVQQQLTKEAVPATAPAHAPQPVAPAVDPALAYNVKLAAAVQAAFEVPGSAKALSFKGKARVEFHLHDGVASAIRVIQSSGLGAVDRAAMKAVEVAKFPLPPAELKNKESTYQIWVACF